MPGSCGRGLNRAGGCAVLCLLATAANSQAVTVLYHEPLGELIIAAPSGAEGPAAKPQVPLSFVAFGKQFELELEVDDRLIWSLPPAMRDRIADVVLYRGRLANVPGAWVRLTRRGTSLSGVIWDGVDLYSIDDIDRVASSLVVPLSSRAKGQVIYRLADTIGAVSDDVVGSSDARNSDAASSIFDELAAFKSASLPLKQIEIGFIADAELVSREGANTAATLLSIANVVDGIFMWQVGVHTNVAVLDILNMEPDAFYASGPRDLLDELENYKANSPTLMNLGLAHLFTGRDLVEPQPGRTIVGVANLNSVCDIRRGVAVTQASSVLTSALIAAHEIGHNFGAPHDGEMGSACEATPQTFLMSPFVNASQVFSACSLQQMQPQITSAACLLTPPSGDVFLRPTRSPDAQTIAGWVFSGAVAVESTGPNDALGLEVVFTGDGVTLSSTIMSGPNATYCAPDSSLAGYVCRISRLAGGEYRNIEFVGRTTRVGPVTLDVSAVALNDSNSANNAYRFPLQAGPSVDFRFRGAEASPSAIRPGDTSDVTFDFINEGLAPGTNVNLEVSTGYLFEPVTFTPPGGGVCSPTSTYAWACAIGTVPQNQAQRLVVRLRAGPLMNIPPGSYQHGTVTLQITAAEPEIDGAFGYTPLIVAPRIADLGVELTGPSSVTEGAPVPLTIVGRNLGPDAVEDVAVTFSHRSAIAIDSIDAGNAVCVTLTNDDRRCTQALLGAGASFTIKVFGTAQVPNLFGYNLSAEIGGATYDEMGINNYAGLVLAVMAPLPPPPPPPPPPPAPPPPSPAASSGGGGGGTMGVEWLLVLLVLRIVEKSRRPTLKDC